MVRNLSEIQSEVENPTRDVLSSDLRAFMERRGDTGSVFANKMYGLHSSGGGSEGMVQARDKVQVRVATAASMYNNRLFDADLERGGDAAIKRQNGSAPLPVLAKGQSGGMRGSAQGIGRDGGKGKGMYGGFRYGVEEN